MKEYSTSIKIRSTLAKVWSILTDASAYPIWNTTVSKIDGTIRLGEEVTVHATIISNQPISLRIIAFEPEKRMVWRSSMPLGFLFNGERTYAVTPAGEGMVEFTMREVFSGLFAPMITKLIPDLQPSFDEFAACLKKRAEG